MSRTSRNTGARDVGQRGIAIVVVLVAIVALAFTAIAALRGSVNTMQVSDNAVAQAQARAAARTALRYCEQTWQSGSAAIDMLPAAPDTPAWRIAGNWFGPSALATPVPDAVDETGAAPRCMVEASAVAASGVEIAIVSARGFSPGFTADDTGRSPTGASAMLQSVVTRPAP